MTLVAAKEIGGIESARQRQRLRVSLILANVFLEGCAQQLRFAEFFHKDERTRKNRRRVEAAQSQLAEAQARKRDAKAALAADMKKQGVKP
ncbi:hypothetical protein O9X98_14285 [Agrobacterium salinitolerans]|nr:hypothetical protein [Agrobacterium salinitolerans]